MENRGFGKTGWTVSAIGFGAWGIGGGMWGNADDERSVAALRAALEAGCTFIDTALVYGEGHSERVVAQALKSWKGPVTVATKVPPMNRLWPARRGGAVAKVFPAGYVSRSVATSAANLGRPIDLLQLHVWRDEWLDDPDWKATEQAIGLLMAAGTIRAFGISINDHEPDSALEAVRRCEMVSAVQVIYNVFEQRPAERLFPLCRERKVAVIARAPLDEGGLTGTITPDTEFDAGDWRNSYFTMPRRRELVERVARLEPVLRKESASLVEGALRFCLSHPDVSTVIPGMRSVAHARDNCRVADGRPLSPALLHELREHAWPRNWYPTESPPTRLDSLLVLALLAFAIWGFLGFVAPLGAGWVHLLLPVSMLLLVRRVVAGRGRW